MFTLLPQAHVISECFTLLPQAHVISESFALLLYTNIDHTLLNSLHGLLNCEICGLDCHVITT